MRTISVIIPYHNSHQIEDVVHDVLYKQKIPSSYRVELVIVCSACHKKNISTVITLQKRLQNKDRIIHVIEQPLAGKPKALNTGLAVCTSDIVVQIVDDIRLDDTLIYDLFNILEKKKQYGAAVAVGRPSNLDDHNLLMRTQRIHHDYVYVNDKISLIGRAFSFRKSLIPEGFPENIMSEDFWLELQARENTKGFIVINSAGYTYKKPETWTDYLKQIDRFDASYKQLRNAFPLLCKKHLRDKPRIKSKFINMIAGDLLENNYFKIIKQFMTNPTYSFFAKCAYLGIGIYRVGYLGIKNRLFSLKTAVFVREDSTL